MAACLYVNAPVALFTALLAWCWIREPKTTAGEAPDLKGLLLVSLTLASLLIALSLYGEYHNITGALALGGLMLFSAGFITAITGRLRRRLLIYRR